MRKTIVVVKRMRGEHADLKETMRKAAAKFNKDNEKDYAAGKISKAELDARKQELDAQVAYQDWKSANPTGIGGTLKKFGGTIVKAMIPGMQEKAFKEAQEKSVKELEKSKAKFTAETGISLQKLADILPATVTGQTVSGTVKGDLTIPTQIGNNMKPSDIVLGPNVLTGQPAINSPYNDTPLQASGFTLGGINPIMIGMIVLVILMVLFGQRQSQ